MQQKLQDDYDLLEEIKNDSGQIAAIYNRNQAEDAIKELDCKELNKNITKVKQLIDCLRRELAYWESNRSTHARYEAQEMTPEQVEEKQMKDWALQRYDGGAQRERPTLRAYQQA